MAKTGLQSSHEAKWRSRIVKEPGSDPWINVRYKPPCCECIEFKDSKLPVLSMLSDESESLHTVRLTRI